METRKDPLTGETFYPRRNNQKFATAKNKMKYHNQLANEERARKKYLDAPLNHNFSILNNLLGAEKEKLFHQEFLLGKGVELNAFNNNFKDGQNNYKAVYNIAIMRAENSMVKIKRI